ncbi:hypothetical protein TTHERM_000382279 (macronuclear) [Tetrahymena thermophila SB210]|uniref:Uncharacterized protein n=1 Tax=Tetrahymena thermophila (strain SB210) TaxID=312017 RepID=W7XIC0_TETTS|nr:hypothetical protein TTHERM_000382279 [Tetrahymena thermophila SB210]EWS74501.1 hypothetical protein TTHERM_000382279 [Tetrahymena thermophila SB210]|eukprot:XP_012652986.1 hypothetical protein TTHERM_000382279 [Tetrahymena thermophila SB210]
MKQLQFHQQLIEICSQKLLVSQQIRKQKHRKSKQFQQKLLCLLNIKKGIFKNNNQINIQKYFLSNSKAHQNVFQL